MGPEEYHEASSFRKRFLLAADAGADAVPRRLDHCGHNRRCAKFGNSRSRLAVIFNRAGCESRSIDAWESAGKGTAGGSFRREFACEGRLADRS
jgi:hypothetical protein